jgi:hypothetical protein
VHTGICGVPEALVRLQAHNAEMRRVGARIEKVFGPCKRLYGVSRMRWLGMARAGLQVRLAAMTHARWREGKGIRPRVVSITRMCIGQAPPSAPRVRAGAGRHASAITAVDGGFQSAEEHLHDENDEV